MRTILTYPHPALTRKCIDIILGEDGLIPKKYLDLADEMIHLMVFHKGAGLAASQVGENVNIFVCGHSQKAQDIEVFFNPKLVKGSGSRIGSEGCLSLPGEEYRIKRNTSQSMSSISKYGKIMRHTAKGFKARIWQHEIDHLNGLLINRG